jgi:cyclopropane fatty-acyl-phospholipid synthase-like methyltransferase
MPEETLKLTEGIKRKFQAWWQGSESPLLDDLTGYKNKLSLWWNGGVSSSSGQGAAHPSQARARSVKAPPRQHQEIHARGRISQALWGEGNLTPGPADFITGLTARLGLTPEMSLLDMGAGLGGPARAMCAAYGVWVTAYEAVPNHIKAGMEQSIMHGMGKKVPFTQFDPETIELPKRKFDCIFSKEMMHHVRSKKRLIAEIEGALKPRGQFILINYVTAQNGANSPGVVKWNEADGQESSFWSKEEYVAAFSEAKLDLRVTENLTEQYIAFIANGFRGLKKNMEKLIADESSPEYQAELRRALAFETNRWAVRSEALQAGDMSVIRFSGFNPLQPEIR